MNKTWTIIKREFVSKVLTRTFLIATLLGPVLLVGIYLIPFLVDWSGGEEPLYVHMVDESGLFGNQLTSLFPDTLSSGRPRFVVTSIPPDVYSRDKADFENSVLTGDIDAIVVIPTNVLQQDSVIYRVKKAWQTKSLQLLHQRLSRAINKIRLQQADLDPVQIEQLTRDVAIVTETIGKPGKSADQGEITVLVAITFVMMLYITIILYGTMVMRGVLEEKTSRILEILLSSSNSFQLMMGKLIGVGSAGLTQYLIWIVISLGAFVTASATLPTLAGYINLSPLVLIYFVVFFLLGYFQFSTLFAAVGAITSSQEDAQAASTPVIVLLILPFIISISLGLQAPDAPTAQVLSLLPFFSPITMFMRTVIGDPPAWQILAAIGVNILTIILFTYLVAKIYRVGILMYGKRPTLPEVLRWIRYR